MRFVFGGDIAMRAKFPFIIILIILVIPACSTGNYHPSGKLSSEYTPAVSHDIRIQNNGYEFASDTEKLNQYAQNEIPDFSVPDSSAENEKDNLYASNLKIDTEDFKEKMRFEINERNWYEANSYNNPYNRLFNGTFNFNAYIHPEKPDRGYFVIHEPLISEENNVSYYAYRVSLSEKAQYIPKRNPIEGKSEKAQYVHVENPIKGRNLEEIEGELKEGGYSFLFSDSIAFGEFVPPDFGEMDDVKMDLTERMKKEIKLCFQKRGSLTENLGFEDKYTISICEFFSDDPWFIILIDDTHENSWLWTFYIDYIDEKITMNREFMVRFQGSVVPEEYTRYGTASDEYLRFLLNEWTFYKDYVIEEYELLLDANGNVVET
jgi:hypothetical protein